MNFFFGGNWGNNFISIKTIDEKKRIITLAHGMTCFSRPWRPSLHLDPRLAHERAETT